MRFWRTWQMVTVCVVLALAGLVAWAFLPGPPTRHDDGDGPLSASTGSGGFTLHARPGVSYGAWAANFLCLTEPGDPAVITRVRHEVRVEPLGLRTFVRTVTPEDLEAADPDGVVIGAARYRRPGGRQREFVGSFSSDVAGTVVRQPCSERVDQENGILQKGFSELVFEIKAGPAGAFVPRTYVDYTRGRREYTLVVNWQMGVCGTRTREVLGEPDCG
ncbi:MAG TPA: hypothetical protein VFV40_06610 [Nocardioides sp.]|nr:hypothetical protein [Nocardioides sp.]